MRRIDDNRVGVHRVPDLPARRGGEGAESPMQVPTTEPPESLPDEAIIARVRAGEKGLFEVLMRRNNRRLYRAARAIVGRLGEDEVVDVVQEAYVRAYLHLGDFAGRARFSTWLTRIAVYEALARLRKRRDEGAEGARRREEAEEMERPADDMGDPEQRAADGELRAALEAAIDALPEHYRVVFVLRAVEELSVAETAECLDIPEETVKTRLFRARALLQGRLGPRVDRAATAAFAFDGARCDRIVAAVLARIERLDGGASS